jgi:hypothetical protein
MALMGIPRNEEPMTIEVTEDGETYQAEGSLYSEAAPDGGFEVGKQYDPNNLSKPVFMRYQRETEDGGTTTDTTQLTGPFKIVDARDEEGNSLDNVELTEGPTYDPSNTSNLQEQLRQTQEEQIRMQERAEETVGGGGGSTPGFVSYLSDDSILRRVGLNGVPNAVPAVGGVGAIWAFLSG